VSAARFIFVGMSVPVAGRGGPPAVVDVLWRLVAGNNHVLGRAPAPCADLASCRAQVEALVAALPTAQSVRSPQSRPGLWGWRLTDDDGDLLAVSSRHYERMRDCDHSLRQFVAAGQVATVSDAVAVRPRSARGPLDGPAHVPLQRHGISALRTS